MDLLLLAQVIDLAIEKGVRIYEVLRQLAQHDGGDLSKATKAHFEEVAASIKAELPSLEELKEGRQ
jgi:hypothetical protein